MVRYHIYKCPQHVPILSHIDPVHAPHPTSWRSILILSSHLSLDLPSGISPSGFPTKTLYTPLPSSIRATCPAYLILLHLVTRTILGEQYRSLSSSLCNFLHSPVTSSFLGPNILNTLFSNTLSLCSFLNVSDQVSHPYKKQAEFLHASWFNVQISCSLPTECNCEFRLIPKTKSYMRRQLNLKMFCCWLTSHRGITLQNSLVYRQPGLIPKNSVFLSHRCDFEWRARNLRKATVSFVISLVRPSLRIQQLVSHWTGFPIMWHWSIFRKSIEKIQVSLKSDKNNGYFTWRHILIYDSISLYSIRMKKIFEAEVVEKIKTHFIICNFFFNLLFIR